eukprot:gene10727-10884_t
MARTLLRSKCLQVFCSASAKVSSTQLGGLFPEFVAAVEGAGGCRFSDCMHLAEPGCAVTAHEFERYEHYLKFLAEIKAQFGGFGGWSGGSPPPWQQGTGGFGGQGGWSGGGSGGGRRCRDGRPLAPRTVQWRSTSNQVEVVWNPPLGDTCVDYYFVRIFQRPSGFLGGIFAQESSPRRVSDNGVIITGLSPSTDYIFEVQAVNRRFGPGPDARANVRTQAPTPQCNPTQVPGVPASLKVTSPSPEKLALVWERPKTPPNACISGFNIEAFDMTTGAKVFSSSVGGDVLKANIPGLKPNSKYRITVVAQNRAGNGLPQVANGQTKPGPPPNCRPGIKPANPVNVTAIPDGLDRLALVWTTIPDGVCIDDFTVRGVEVATGKPVTDVITTERNTSAVLLQPGVEYKFTVVSRNKAGSSSPAVVTASIPKPLPAQPSCDVIPAAPINLTAVANGTDRIILTWANGNESICVDSYSARGVESLTNKGALTTSTVYPNATAVGLTPGVNYTFTITATNKKGTSQPATITYMIPKPEPVCTIKPAAPVNVTVVPASDTRLNISWINGNSSICVESFTVEGVETISGKGVLKTSTINSNTFAAGLAPGVNYTFTITAVNKIGSGEQVKVTAIIPAAKPACDVKPAAAINLTAVPAGDSKINLTWANGNPNICVDAFAVEGAETATGKPALKVSTVSNSTFASGLTAGVNYTFTVTAVNKVGQSESVKIISSIPKLGPAGCTDGVAAQVRNFEAKLGGPGELVLNWKVPKNNICIKEYVITVKETGQSFRVPPKNDKQDGQLKFKAPPGKEGSSFTFTVTGFSNPGNKEGVSFTSNTLPTLAGRRRLLMLQQLLLSLVPGQH